MKALSVRQPWAGLIVAGHKDVENRSWYTPWRGQLLIHAAQKIDDSEDSIRFIAKRLDVAEARIFLDRSGFFRNPGCIIGAADLWDCLDPHCRHFDSVSQWRDPNKCGWYLHNPLLFQEPIPFRGRLGLFGAPDELVAEQLKRAMEIPKHGQL